MSISNTVFKYEHCYQAAEAGDLQELTRMFEAGFPLKSYDEDDDVRLTTSYAAVSGHLDCLKYAHKNGCPWDEWTPSRAALNGHIHCLVYAFENGCPYNIEKEEKILKEINQYKQQLKIIKNNLENHLSSDLINHVINKFI